MKWIVVVALGVLTFKVEAGDLTRSYGDYESYASRSSRLMPVASALPPARDRAEYESYRLQTREFDGLRFEPISVEGYDRQEGKRITRGRLFQNGRYVGTRTVEEGYDNRQNFRYDYPR